MLARTMRRLRALSLAALALVAGAHALEAGSGRPVDWNRLTLDGQRLVQPVLAGSQVTRDVRNIRYPSSREIWEYLLDNPDFAADVARVLREGKYRIQRVGDHYEADDGRGVNGLVRPLYVEGGRRIFYLEGRYDSRWFPTLRGRAVLVLDSEYTEGTDRTPHADVRLAGYLRIDNFLLGAFLAVARDFSEKAFDEKVRKFFGHVERVNRRARDDPRGLADLLAAQPGLKRERVAEFRAILLDRPRPARRV